jgi:hypothetical protein
MSLTSEAFENEVELFNTSRLKSILPCFVVILPIGFCIGVFLNLCDVHWNFITLLRHWPYYGFKSLMVSLLIFAFPFFPTLFRDGCGGVKVFPQGLMIIKRVRDRNCSQDHQLEIPWEAIKVVRMKIRFPKALNMVNIELLCSEDDITSESFHLSVWGKRKILESLRKDGPKPFSLIPRAFPSGLLVFSLPWQLQYPEEFKAAVLQEAPPDHPLVHFFSEHPELVQ